MCLIDQRTFGDSQTILGAIDLRKLSSKMPMYCLYTNCKKVLKQSNMVWRTRMSGKHDNLLIEAVLSTNKAVL